MITPITPVRPVTLPETPQIAPTADKSNQFQSLLEGMIGRVENSQAQAQQSVSNFLGGGTEELHSVALATQRAELEFNMFLQVRNKVVSAYQEVMRMQV